MLPPGVHGWIGVKKHVSKGEEGERDKKGESPAGLGVASAEKVLRTHGRGGRDSTVPVVCADERGPSVVMGRHRGSTDYRLSITMQERR